MTHALPTPDPAAAAAGSPPAADGSTTGAGGSTTGADGVEGNRRLTSVTGLLLVVLLAIEGVTILAIRQLISIHIIVGTIIVLPVLLKLGTTGYRFARYYRRDTAYVQAGPPNVILRVIGPFVVLTSVALLGTGLLAVLTDSQSWVGIHKTVFWVWFAFMTVHVLGHILQAAREASTEIRDRTRVSRGRLALVAIVLLAGVGLAAVVYPQANSWTNDQVQQFDH